jgi:hypothetical protein
LSNANEVASMWNRDFLGVGVIAGERILGGRRRLDADARLKFARWPRSKRMRRWLLGWFEPWMFRVAGLARSPREMRMLGDVAGGSGRRHKSCSDVASRRDRWRRMGGFVTSIRGSVARREPSRQDVHISATVGPPVRTSNNRGHENLPSRMITWRLEADATQSKAKVPRQRFLLLLRGPRASPTLSSAFPWPWRQFCFIFVS